jgi:hypothetical protein
MQDSFFSFNDTLPEEQILITLTPSQSTRLKNIKSSSDELGVGLSNAISLEAISQEEEADEGDATRFDILDRSASGVVRVVLSNSISLEAISQEEEADEKDETRLSCDEVLLSISFSSSTGGA